MCKNALQNSAIRVPKIQPCANVRPVAREQERDISNIWGPEIAKVVSDSPRSRIAVRLVNFNIIEVTGQDPGLQIHGTTGTRNYDVESRPLFSDPTGLVPMPLQCGIAMRYRACSSCLLYLKLAS